MTSQFHDTPSILSWLDQLQRLLPPSGVLLVGAGSGNGPWVRHLRQWDTANVTLVEADNESFQQLQHTTLQRDDWHLRQQVIGVQAGGVTYHQASLAAESGLLPPEALRDLWPNLKTRSTETRQAISLAELLPPMASATAPSPNWLVLDCLPASALLKNAGPGLATLDVIVARVLLGTPTTSLETEAAHLADAQTLLASYGYRLLTTETGRHPAVGHALFVRDIRATLRSASRRYMQAEHAAATAEQLAAELAQQLEAANKIKDEQTKIAAERQQQLAALQEVAERGQVTTAQQIADLATQAAQLTQAKAVAEQWAAELTQRLEQAGKAKDEQTELVAKQQEQLTLLQQTAEQASGAAAKQAADLTARSVQLTKAKVSAEQLAAERAQQLEQANKDKDEQSRLAAKRQEQLISIQQAADQANAIATRQAADLTAQATRLKVLKAELDRVRQEAEQVAQQSASQAEQALIQRDERIDALKKRVQVLQAQAPTTTPLPPLETLKTDIMNAMQELRASINQKSAVLQASIQNATEISASRHTGLHAVLSDLRDSATLQQDNIKAVAQQVKQIDLEKSLDVALAIQLTKQQASDKENSKEIGIRMRNELNKGLTNMVRQVEAFISIQNYLLTGESLADFHGWPISPDIGLFLLEKMRERRYDLIIEFGSGTSTVLFAKALETLSHRAQQDTAEHGQLATARVVSFEHDTLYHKKTLQMLQARGLANLVQLVHAPLVDWHDGEQSYLYYDCQAVLAELAQKHAHHELRILLLVDGPPGTTCANARYPAIPLIFSFLGKHQIDLVLDDANRPEEKAVIELWREFWKKRSIHMAEAVVPSEKGIHYATNQ